MISEFFTDDELADNLRSHFDDEQQFDTDFKVFFNHIIDRGVDFYLEFRGRKFSIDKITGDVVELV